MPTLTITSRPRGRRGNETAAQVVGGVLSTTPLGPIGEAFAQALFSGTAPKPPPAVQVDSDTGALRILGRDGEPLAVQPVQAAILSDIWLGNRPASIVGKRWRETARALEQEGRAFRALPIEQPENPPMPNYPYIPPGGLAGFNNMTMASRLALSRAPGTKSRRRRRKAKKAVPRTAKRGAKRAASGNRKFVKGSAAAKKFMAKLRRMRKR